MWGSSEWTVGVAIFLLPIWWRGSLAPHVPHWYRVQNGEERPTFRCPTSCLRGAAGQSGEGTVNLPSFKFTLRSVGLAGCSEAMQWNQKALSNTRPDTAEPWGLNDIFRREFTTQFLSGALICPAPCHISRGIGCKHRDWLTELTGRHTTWVNGDMYLKSITYVDRLWEERPWSLQN